MSDFNSLLKRASDVYSDNFSQVTWFGRCIFLSWYCDVGTCEFCFRSTIKHKIRHAKSAKRDVASILAEAIIGKHLGWRVEFLTGGYRIFPFDEIVEIARLVSSIYEYKIWVNLGALDEESMRKLSPYIEGVCASIETVESGLHDRICPDKPIAPYSDMLNTADLLGLKKSMTIVIGLGEKKEDFELLADFISVHSIDRITFYALKPVAGTCFTESPDPEDYAWWVAKTRVRFPKIEIIAGMTPQKAQDYAGLLLRAGANALTKFPAVKRFGSKQALEIEKQAAEAGREFKGSMSRLPNVDWEAEITALDVSETLKSRVRSKFDMILEQMKSKSKDF